MTFSVKVFFTIFSIFFIFAIVRIEAHSSSEEMRCEQCTMKINATLRGMPDLLKDRDNTELTTPDPCSPCIFSGIITVKLNAEVCPVKVMEGDDNCYDHELKLNYKKITVNCTCTLPYNPKDVAALLVEKSKDPFQGLKCGKTGETPIDPKVLGAEMAGTMKVDPLSMMKMTACQPRVPPMTGFTKPPTEVTGGIKGIYEEFQFKATIRSCAINKEVRTTKLVRDTSVGKSFDVKCIATVDEAFLQPCECFAKTDYLDQIVSGCITSLIPCLGGEKFDDDKEFITQMTCNDLLDD